MYQTVPRRGVSARPFWAALAAVLLLAQAGRSAEWWSALIDPDNSLWFNFLRGEKPVFRAGLAGPDWFAFKPSKEVPKSVLDMNDWLDRPAGKHGGVRTVKDRFEFSDGTPVKFWGVNLSYTASAPDKATADFSAARFAKHGINALRMHKFSYPKKQMGIGDLNDSTRMDPEGLDRLDYLASKLKERGVYFGWSHGYGFRVVPGDRKRLLAYDEIAKGLKGNTYSFINFAEDVQDLMIEMVVNLLEHKNPYTGLTYADEPALCFIELQNEDDIFWYSSAGALDACPTYKKRFLARFAAWLKDRYGSQDKLQAAWAEALRRDERLSEGNIAPQLNPWFFGEDHLAQEKGPARRIRADVAGQFPWGVWDADVPTSLGQHPALARTIYRGEVKEGHVISVRRVSPTDLAEGRFSFTDKVQQRGDVKSFGGSVAPEALAAGRVVVEFTDKSQPSQLPDMKRYRQGPLIKSVTGQLAWDTSGKGVFTVNTAGTKAVVGFAQGKELTLGDVKVRLDCPFASLFVTALDRQSDLGSGKRTLITALARQGNTGFAYFTPDNKVMDNGRPPLLLEPVKATLTISGRTIAAVNVLDHDGRRTDRKLTVTDGKFTLDGAKDKTIYYEVAFR